VERRGAQGAYPVLLEGEGRVLLAGEHLSYLTGWQAGAIESAWQQIARIHERAQRMKLITLFLAACWRPRAVRRRAGDGRQGAVREELRGLPPGLRQGHPGAFPRWPAVPSCRGLPTTSPAVLLKGSRRHAGLQQQPERRRIACGAELRAQQLGQQGRRPCPKRRRWRCATRCRSPRPAAGRMSNKH
jgi:hypothetical protein